MELIPILGRKVQAKIPVLTVMVSLRIEWLLLGNLVGRKMCIYFA